MLVGATIEGGVVSRTVTLKVAVAVLAEKSVAVQDTVVIPRAKVEPDVGEQTTAGSGSTMSMAVAEKGTEGPARAVASTGMSGRRDRVGGGGFTHRPGKTRGPKLTHGPSWGHPDQ